MLLECCYFVHCCNKGQWPAWMKHNLAMFRASGPLPRDAKGGGPHTGLPTGLPTGLRRTHVMQRAAGKMFCQWAEVSGEGYSAETLCLSSWVHVKSLQ